MRTQRRNFLAAAFLPLVAPLSRAADEGPLRLVVGFPPGDSADVLARLLAQPLGELLKRPVVVDNRSGAGGLLAAQAVKNAPADGNTVMLAPSGLFTIYPHTYARLPYDPGRDFKPLAIAARMNFAIAVDAGRGPGTMAQLLERLPRETAMQNFGTGAAGSLMHFVGLRMGELARVPVTHIPYRGSTPAKQALLAGDIGFVVAPIASIWDLVSSGRMRVLATAGNQRDPLLPEVPTLRESGFDVDGYFWHGLYVSAATPAGVTEVLSQAVLAALKVPELGKRIGELGLIVTPVGPAQVDAAMQAQERQWGPFIRRSGFKAD